MSVLYNETPFDTIKYNGKTLKKIIFNGKTVFDKTLLRPKLSIRIEDAEEKKGYAQAYLSCYNPNDFAVSIIVESFKVGSVSANRNLTGEVVFYSGEGTNRVGAKGIVTNAPLVYNKLGELAVPYGGCLTIHFLADDGRVSNSTTVLHDDWNSTAT